MLQLIISLSTQAMVTEVEKREEDQGIDYFVRPDPAKIQAFLKHHPRQDVNNPVVKKVFTSRRGMVRLMADVLQQTSCFVLFCLPGLQQGN